MNRTRQIFALLPFNLRTNPFVGFMLIAFGTPMIINFTIPASYLSLSSLLMTQNLFMVGIIGAWVFAPELLQTAATRGFNMYSGTEFLLTRAIDRTALYRSRAIYFYFLILILPLISLGMAEHHSSLLLAEYSKPVQAQLLEAFPGSSLRTDRTQGLPHLFIPTGRVWLAFWQIWTFVVAALALQLAIAIIHRLTHRTLIFYVVFLGTSFLPLVLTVAQIRSDPSSTERSFLLSASHPVVFWLLTAVAFVLVQAWCERRFLRQEY